MSPGGTQLSPAEFGLLVLVALVWIATYAASRGRWDKKNAPSNTQPPTTPTTGDQS